MRVLLDTCAILWAVGAPQRLSARARAVLKEPETEVFVLAISAAEIACACERRRIALDRHWKAWFRHYVQHNQWECLSIDLAIVEEAYSLPPPFHPDPVDRLLVATARLQGLGLVTGDEKMLEYPHVETLW